MFCWIRALSFMYLEENCNYLDFSPSGCKKKSLISCPAQGSLTGSSEASKMTMDPSKPSVRWWVFSEMSSENKKALKRPKEAVPCFFPPSLQEKMSPQYFKICQSWTAMVRRDITHQRSCWLPCASSNHTMVLEVPQLFVYLEMKSFWWVYGIS